MTHSVEQQYADLRDAGYDRRGAAMTLMLSYKSEASCERAYKRQQPTTPASARAPSAHVSDRDSSVPRFGLHAAHLAKIGPRGFPIIRGRQLYAANGTLWRAA